MRKMLKRIPRFETEAQERRFWQTHDSTDYVNYSKAENWRFPNLRPTSKSITIRLPLGLIERLKIMAHRQDIPYQTLIKQLIFQAIAK